MTSRGIRTLGAAMAIAFAASVSALVVAAGPAGAATAAEAPKPVVVTNPASQAIPVKLAQIVQVLGTLRLDPAANTVKLDPAANTVKLDPVANTVRFAPAPLERVNLRKSVTIDDDSTVHNGDFIELLTVPAGKRFVADFVSATGDCFYADDMTRLDGLSALVADGGVRMEMPLEITPGKDNATSFYPLLHRYGGPIGFWGDAGGKVYWQVRSFARSCVWSLYLSGHHEPMS